jgi:hypothetical protein
MQIGNDRSRGIGRDLVPCYDMETRLTDTTYTLKFDRIGP